MPHIDLLGLPYFEGISIDEVVALVDLMRPCMFKAGSHIMEEDTTHPCPLYIATSGRVLLTKKSLSGHPRQLAELSPPTLFGEIELFCQLPAVTTVLALDDVHAFSLDRKTFNILLTSPNNSVQRFTYNVARVACHRLAVADQMLAQMLSTEDLVTMRRAVFLKMRKGHEDEETVTGMFKKPLAD